ncbi:MAG: PDZ domain-containing protein [Deltaproteobacteria bacterium]|nr:PDZ domain-containing protein [Deltaproteobacteria bacterium]
MAKAMELKSDTGVVITRVVHSSPADRAGLKTGDIVLRFKQTKVERVAELEALIAGSEPGDTCSIVVDRQDQQRSFYVELAAQPTYLMKVAMSTKTDLDSQWGCTLAPISPDLVGQLSLPASISGVAVVAVDQGGLAKKAGMLPGDVIVSVNREPTPDLSSFYRAIEDGQTLVLEVYRNGEAVFLTVDASTASSPLATIAGSVRESSSIPQRVAVAADGNGPSAQLSLRFGTAPFFIISDLTSDMFMAVKNEVQTSSRGFGIAAAQLVAAQGVGAAISRDYGPQAYDALKVLNIVPYTAEGGTVSDVLKKYRAGLLSEASQATLPGYSYSRSIVATGGGSSGDEEEEQSGYKGKPSSIPPQGKYDPAQDPSSSVQAVAGSSQRTEYCYCPICQKLFPHPPSISCADLTCPDCGTRLRTWDPGSNSLAVGSGAPAAGSAPASTGSAPFAGIPFAGQAMTRVLPTGANPSAAGVSSSSASSPFAGAPFASPAAPQLPAAGNSPLVGGGAIGSAPMGAAAMASMPTARAPIASAASTQNQGQMRLGATGTGLLQDLSPLYLNQQTQYCYCPVCHTIHEHPPGVPCSSLVCPVCGSRLLSLTAALSLLPAAQAMAGLSPMGQIPTALATEMATLSMTSQTPFQGSPQRPSYSGAAKGQRDLDASASPAGQISVGVTVAGPNTAPSQMGQVSAGMTIGGKPETIPPVGPGQAVTAVSGPTTIPPGVPRTSGATPGQAAAIVTVAGQPMAIPGQSSTRTMAPGQVMVNSQMGMTSASRTTASAATNVTGMPTAGTLGTSASTGLLQGAVDGECICPRCGAKVPHVRGTACYTTTCPVCGTPMVRDGAVIGQLGLSAARTVAGDAASSAVTITGDDAGKICIATSGSSMSDHIAPMFDRAPYFMIVGLGTCKVVANPNVDDRTGAGVQSAQLVVSEGSNVVITNDISVKALEELSRLRIRVYTGVSGTAAQGLEWYQAGRLTPSTLDAGSHEEHEEHGASKGKGTTSSTRKL